jgi:hypothetical protein
MYYQPFGPFDVPRPIGEAGDRWHSKFWSNVEIYWQGLSEANGVYVFSMRHGSKSVPWYIGKTCSERGFSREAFQPHKLRIYKEVTKGRKGFPQLHLIAKVEPTRENFCRYSERSRRQIDQLETYMIGMGLTRNPEMQNDKKTSFHRSLEIKGVIGPRYKGARTKDARTLRRVLGLTGD